MAARPMQPLAVTEIKLGLVTFYGAELERHCGIEYVRYQMCTEAILDMPLNENGGRPILVDRRTWDEMARAVAAMGAGREVA